MVTAWRVQQMQGDAGWRWGRGSVSLPSSPVSLLLLFSMSLLARGRACAGSAGNGKRTAVAMATGGRAATEATGVDDSAARCSPGPNCPSILFAGHPSIVRDWSKIAQCRCVATVSAERSDAKLVKSEGCRLKLPSLTPKWKEGLLPSSAQLDGEEEGEGWGWRKGAKTEGFGGRALWTLARGMMRWGMRREENGSRTVPSPGPTPSPFLSSGGTEPAASFSQRPSPLMSRPTRVLESEWRTNADNYRHNESLAFSAWNRVGLTILLLVLLQLLLTQNKLMVANSTRFCHQGELVSTRTENSQWLIRVKKSFSVEHTWMSLFACIAKALQISKTTIAA